MANMTSPIIGGRHVAPASTTVYASLNHASNNAWDATESNVSSIVPLAGTLNGLTVKLETAPGAGKTRTLTVMKNGSATSLAITISDTNTTGSTTSGLTLAAGDKISIRSEQTGTAASSARISWYSSFIAVAQPLMLVMPSFSANLNLPVQGFAAVTVSVGIPWPTAGTISTMYLSAENSGTQGTCTFTLYKNGVATTLTAQLTGGSSTVVTETTQTITVTAGDSLFWRTTGSGSYNGSNIKVGVIFTPSVAGESVFSTSFASGNVPSTSAVNYCNPVSTNTYSATETARITFFPACLLRKFYAVANTSPGGTASWTTVVRKNTTDTTLATSIAATTTTNSDTTHSVTLNDNDSVTVSITPSNTPTSTHLQLAMVAFIDPGSPGFRLLGGRKGGRASTNNLSNLAYWGPIASGYTLNGSAVPNNLSAGALSVTSRSYHIASYPTDFIRYVSAWATPNGSIGESTMPNAVSIKAAIQRNSTSGHSTQDGAIYPVTFNNAQTVTKTYDYAISDPTYFPVKAKERFFTRNTQTVANTNYSIMGGYRTMARPSQENVDTGDGISAGDLAYSGTIDLTTSDPNTYGPQTILGYFPDGVKPRSVALVGDSIFAGTEDPSGYGSGMGGFGQRIVSGQLNLAFDETIDPVCPFIPLSKGGETLVYWLANHTVRLPLANLCTTWIQEMGTNDLGDSVTTIKANMLSLAMLAINNGARRIIRTTLIPKTTSTDGWRTASNQTTLGSIETKRVQLNDWIRDPGGFTAEVIALGATSDQIRIFDSCAALEVNSSNILTTNGGYWKAPSSTAPNYAGTIANSSSLTTSSMRANLAALGTNTSRGWVGVFNTGALANEVFTTRYTILRDTNTTLQIVTGGTFSTTPSVGDTFTYYSSIDAVLCRDGVHPTPAGHALIARLFDTNLII